MVICDGGYLIVFKTWFDYITFLVPDMLIMGSLSSVYINVDLSQFSLIMGMLGENLGEPLDAFAAPSSVLVDPLVMVITISIINLYLVYVFLIVSTSSIFFSFKFLSNFYE